jgi:hypothetical protein
MFPRRPLYTRFYVLILRYRFYMPSFFLFASI